MEMFYMNKKFKRNFFFRRFAQNSLNFAQTKTA